MDLINVLSEKGTLGLLLAIAIVAIIYLFIQLQRSQNSRINDAKEFGDKQLVFADKMKESMDTQRNAFELLTGILKDNLNRQGPTKRTS